MTNKKHPSRHNNWTDFQRDLFKRINDFNSAPVLFVGAGISKRYLGLPSWDGLLESLSKKTSKEYSYYRVNANGDLSRIAGLLAEPLNKLIWSKSNASLRKKFDEHLLTQDSALKIYASEIISAHKPTKDPSLIKEIDLFKKVVVDAVITTNYDRFIDDIFPDYQNYVGQDELLFSDPRGVGEVYKIHGSITKPNSLVLTDADYETYNERNAYLAAKLLTLFAEHPVIFLGYSLSDPNVTQILESLVSCLKPEHISKLQDRLFFVQWEEGSQPIVASTVIPIMGTNLPVISITVPNFVEIYKVLGSLKRKFPASTLRRLKNCVYELILTNDPKSRLTVTDLEKDDDEVDVVIGVGAVTALGEAGYIPITREDLVSDILHDDRKFSFDAIVQKTLPSLLSRTGRFPFIKYLIKGNFIDADGNILRKSDMDKKLIKHYEKEVADLKPAKSQQKKALKLANEAGDFKTLVKNNGYQDVFMSLSALPSDNIKPSDLHAFLVKHENVSTQPDGKLDSFFVKAVCIYDRLKYLSKPW